MLEAHIALSATVSGDERVASALGCSARASRITPCADGCSIKDITPEPRTRNVTLFSQFFRTQKGLPSS